jgi:hypothetical protein
MCDPMNPFPIRLITKWCYAATACDRPSVIVLGEGNYTDAHSASKGEAANVSADTTRDTDAYGLRDRWADSTPMSCACSRANSQESETKLDRYLRIERTTGLMCFVIDSVERPTPN